MIELEVIAAKESNLIGRFIFHKSLIYIGSNYESDLYYPNSKLQKNHLFLEIVENKLFLHIHKNVDYILVNEKRTTNFKNVKVSDILSVEDLKLKVIDFKLEEYQTKRNFLNQQVENIKQNNPELLEIITDLSKQL